MIIKSLQIYAPLEYKTGDCRFAPIPGYSVLGLFQSQISITTQPLFVSLHRNIVI